MTGAAGFMSNVSSWLGPPHSQTRMTAFAEPGGESLRARLAPKFKGRATLAVVSEEEARWVLDNYPGNLLDVAPSLLQLIPQAVIPRILERASEPPKKVGGWSLPEQPMTILSDWVEDIGADAEEWIRRRRMLAQDFHADGALAGDHVRVVERVHEGQPLLALEPLQEVQDLGLDRDVERRGRLVEQQHLGLGHQRAGDRQLLLLAAGQVAAAPAEELLCNNMEPAAFEKYLALPVLLARLRGEFGLVPRMSGSGSACFALLREDSPVDGISAAIRSAWGPTAHVIVTRLA